MAKLIKCKDCGKEISKNAKSCPNCGAKIVKTSMMTWLVLIFIIAFGVHSINNDGKTNSKPVKQLTEKEKRIKNIEDQFSIRDGSHIKVESFIKKLMNNPDSYEHVRTKYIDNGDSLQIITTFRETNAFGGVVKETMRFKVDMNGNIIKILK